MAYTKHTLLAKAKNHGGTRSLGVIDYIVIHYTANDGDSAKGNANYFHNNVVKASAHYFVDDINVYQSVKDNVIAYSVGGFFTQSNGAGKYYKKCTNTNSISIEMTDTKKNGKVMVSDLTRANTIALVKKLMKKYGIPSSHVIRHWDVNGKSCPAYYKGSDNAKWKAFKAELTATPTKTEPAKTEPSKKEPAKTPTPAKPKGNDWVRDLQKACNAQGYSHQDVDGIAGKNTLNGCPTLHKGAKGQITKLLQKRLNALGYKCGTPDGVFGNKTLTAVKKFQKAKGLSKDGIVGKNTWKKLLGL